MKTHYCIYQLGKTNIEAACIAGEGEELKDPYSGETFDALIAELNDKREEGSPAFRIMPLEEALPLLICQILQ